MSVQPAPMHSQEERQSSNNSAIVSARYVCFGQFHLDLKKEELFNGAAPVKLQGKIYQALLALLQKPGEIVTRQELRMQLWPDAQVNYDANVNTTVNKLRQILGDSADQPAFVETIPRKGYSFIAKVEHVDHAPAIVPPQPAKLSSATAVRERAERTASFFRPALLSRWFTVGVVTLVIASMLFGAALVLYAHR
jgi:DNA-binding winged helix-turn-helix (wHTH) protein